MHMFTTLQGQASDVLHGIPKGATYEETIGALEDGYGDQHLVPAYCAHLETRTQLSGGPLQVCHPSCLPALHKDVCRGPVNAFSDTIRDKDINSTYFW
jgi:hypothetical protein